MKNQGHFTIWISAGLLLALWGLLHEDIRACLSYASAVLHAEKEDS